MKYPNILSARFFTGAVHTTEARVPPGMAWVPARPRGYPSFANRVRAAWLVFTGQADAITWEGQ